MILQYTQPNRGAGGLENFKGEEGVLQHPVHPLFPPLMISDL